jgi:hypothetical protein
VPTGSTRDGQQFAHLAGVRTRGNVESDVLFRLERSQGPFGSMFAWTCDDDRVDVGPSQQVVDARIDGSIGRARARETPRSFARRIAAGDDFEFGSQR